MAGKGLRVELVSLQRQQGYDPDEVLAAVRQALEPLGGMTSFVTEGQRVILKPNLILPFAPEKAATTHPSIVRAAAILAKECGGVVSIGDSPGIGTARKAAEKAGIADIARELGITIVEFTPAETLNEDRSFKKLELAKELLEADVVINLPKVKTHCQMLLTLAAKNLFGSVVGLQKFEWHYRAGTDKLVFARMLVEICEAVNPALSIIDGIVAMDGNGPTNGKPNPTNFIGASRDPFALDATVAEIVGVPPDELWVLQAAEAAGISAWKERHVVGEKISNLKVGNWTPPVTANLHLFAGHTLAKMPRVSNWLRARLTALPYALKACIRCGECITICPANAITDSGTGICIDKTKCIRCYCCHELCRHDGLGLKRGILARLMGRHK